MAKILPFNGAPLLLMVRSSMVTCFTRKKSRYRSYSLHMPPLYTPSTVYFAYIQQVMEFTSIITNIKSPFFHIHIQYFLFF